MYDEQVALLGRPANFSLHHEGQQQAVKPAPEGSGRKKKLRAEKDNEEEEEKDIGSYGGVTATRRSMMMTR